MMILMAYESFVRVALCDEIRIKIDTRS